MKKLTPREFWIGFFRNIFAVILALFVTVVARKLLGLWPDGIRRN